MIILSMLVISKVKGTRSFVLMLVLELSGSQHEDYVWCMQIFYDDIRRKFEIWVFEIMRFKFTEIKFANSIPKRKL